MRCDVTAPVITAGNRTLHTSLTSYTERRGNRETSTCVCGGCASPARETRRKREKGRVNIRWAQITTRL